MGINPIAKGIGTVADSKSSTSLVRGFFLNQPRKFIQGLFGN
jgi:hypothetical protein